MVDSGSGAPDQIKMYHNRDTIPQLLAPTQDVVLPLLKAKSKYRPKHFMSGPNANYLVLFFLES